MTYEHHIQTSVSVRALRCGMDDMNAKQQRFVTEYLVDLNATQAATRANWEAVQEWAKKEGHS